VLFLAVWYGLRSFGIFFPFLVCLDKEKSGNPAWRATTAFFDSWLHLYDTAGELTKLCILTAAHLKAG
jgi:hypothetical protein